MGVTMKCTDVIEGCDFAAWAENEEELLELVTIHVREAHGLADLSDEVLTKVKDAIAEA